MLCDPKLSLLSGDEQQFESYEERPQHKLTEFRLLLMTLFLEGQELSQERYSLKEKVLVLNWTL